MRLLLLAIAMISPSPLKLTPGHPDRVTVINCVPGTAYRCLLRNDESLIVAVPASFDVSNYPPRIRRVKCEQRAANRVFTFALDRRRKNEWHAIQRIPPDKHMLIFYDLRGVEREIRIQVRPTAVAQRVVDSGQTPLNMCIHTSWSRQFYGGSISGYQVQARARQVQAHGAQGRRARKEERGAAQEAGEEVGCTRPAALSVRRRSVFLEARK
jgi:hypothetical protein